MKREVIETFVDSVSPVLALLRAAEVRRSRIEALDPETNLGVQHLLDLLTSSQDLESEKSAVTALKTWMTAQVDSQISEFLHELESVKLLPAAAKAVACPDEEFDLRPYLSRDEVLAVYKPGALFRTAGGDSNGAWQKYYQLLCVDADSVKLASITDEDVVKSVTFADLRKEWAAMIPTRAQKWQPCGVRCRKEDF